jgi:hypothetical protein
LISIIDLEFHNFEDMSCPDPKSIYVINTNGNIFKSLDSGKNFKLITFDEIEYIRSIEMFDEKIGVLDGGSLITIDGWETYKDFSIKKGESYFTFHSAVFVNDSIILSLAREYILSLPVEMQYQNSFILNLNINSLEYTLYPLDSVQSLEDCQKFKSGDLIICGKSNNLTGGSGRDAIYKSTDGGVTWMRVLDIYPTWGSNKLSGIQPFGLQSIAFKDEKTGIAVGQFGKILYTYDGGESWIYENNLHDSIAKNIPPTMIVRYAGDTPILATFNGRFYRMITDDYAPGSSDTLSISGRVWEGDKGQAGIPIAIGYHVTMTDKNGYYKFTQLSKGSYKVRALNKYYDGGNPDYYYKPFAYHPEQHEFELTGDTTGIDFDAEDIRDYYNLSGAVTDIDGKGIAGIELSMGDSLTTTTSDGSYEFIRLEKKQYNITPLNEGYIYIPETYVIGLISDTTDIVFQAIPDTTNYIETIEPDPYGLQIKNGILHFDEVPALSQMHLIISDLSGRELLNEPMKQEHNINFLSPGVYIISLRKQGVIVRSYKVVVE